MFFYRCSSVYYTALSSPPLDPLFDTLQGCQWKEYQGVHNDNYLNQGLMNPPPLKLMPLSWSLGLGKLKIKKKRQPGLFCEVSFFSARKSTLSEILSGIYFWSYFWLWIHINQLVTWHIAYKRSNCRICYFSSILDWGVKGNDEKKRENAPPPYSINSSNI